MNICRTRWVHYHQVEARENQETVLLNATSVSRLNAYATWNLQLQDEGHHPLHDDINGKDRVQPPVGPSDAIWSMMDVGASFEYSNCFCSRPVDNSQQTSLRIEQGGHVVLCAVVIQITTRSLNEFKHSL